MDLIEEICKLFGKYAVLIDEGEPERVTQYFRKDLEKIFENNDRIKEE